MPQRNLHQPFEIEHLTLEKFRHGARQNNFFELIYIVEGTGVQHTNNNRFNYRKGNLFLLTPQDRNSFEIATTTQFFFLRFTANYVSIVKDRDWTERIEFILNNASHRPGCILKNQADKPIIASLVENIIREQCNQQLYFYKIIQQLVNAIIVIVARNIALKLPKNIKENTGEEVLDILHYIQQHIQRPDKLKAKEISQQLNISLSYLGRYFKKQTGETLQEYIGKYKVRLIEIRLVNTDMRINEIAHELSFTDESHLNRIFRKYKGISPSEYRKQFYAVSV
jgi:AraC-like DNA-binding protein